MMVKSHKTNIRPIECHMIADSLRFWPLLLCANKIDILKKTSIINAVIALANLKRGQSYYNIESFFENKLKRKIE